VVVDEGTIKDSNAAFGEIGYDITPTVEVHAGLRETFNHAYGNGGVFVIPAHNLEVQSNQVGETDNFATGRIGVNWAATPDQFVYAFMAKGAKTGGINASGVHVFSPESVYDYEAGVKSTWFGGHLRTQADVFDMDYKNMQLAVLTPTPGIAPQQSITNVGKSTIRGAELSVQSRYGGLQVDGNLAYVHSAIGSSPRLLNAYLYAVQGLSPRGVQCAPGQTSGCFDFTPYYESVNGTANPYSPHWTANIGAQYAVPLAGEATLTPRADFSYSSEQWATIFQNPVDQFQARHVLNFSLEYARDRWNITAYGTNLTKDYYKTGLTGTYNFWGDPAVYGVRFTESF
ncbi:MAG: TonB-dependent receptor, partial [Gammaproteobacteria bacterium]|nr:TonB-dependent receptor [Gammaproteobacteria bacterium]